LGIGAEPG